MSWISACTSQVGDFSWEKSLRSLVFVHLTFKPDISMSLLTSASFNCRLSERNVWLRLHSWLGGFFRVFVLTTGIKYKSFNPATCLAAMTKTRKDV